MTSAPDSPQVGVIVKPLEWVHDSLDSGWWAESILGSYRVFHGSRWRLCGGGDARGTDAGSEASAKAAAQADYEARILSALDLSALRARLAVPEDAALDVLVRRLEGADEYVPVGHDAWEAADAIMMLCACLSGSRLDRLHAEASLADALKREEAAEARLAEMRAALIEPRRAADLISDSPYVFPVIEEMIATIDAALAQEQPRDAEEGQPC